MDIAVGALLGLAYIAAPGPINVETLRRGLAGGTRAALALQLGACLGHLTYAALALLGLGVLALAAPVHLLLGLAGTDVLTYLGVAAVHDGWHGWAGGSAAAHPSGDRLALAEEYGNPPSTRDRLQQAPLVGRTLALGAAISLANPFALAFWLTIGGSVLHQAHRNGVLFLGGFFLSVVLWAVGMPALLGWGRTAVRGRLFNGVSMVCGGTLIAFGLTFGHALTATAA